ncbi:hypothetical protein Hypma_000651 [Hypsizygus marmoreus]|uniref:Uncharacterized protein n=1 Tax=Hypsizygus marmoreus TaxID=39966 RepID=A0A369JCK2_HYPMA|nr:hypothetical protein Hypma_000651 [Hypsizygus marmoreus]
MVTFALEISISTQIQINIHTTAEDLGYAVVLWTTKRARLDLRLPTPLRGIRRPCLHFATFHDTLWRKSVSNPSQFSETRIFSFGGQSEETGVLEARPALFKKIYNSPTSAKFEGHVYTLLRFMTRFGENRSATLRSSPKRRIFSFGGQSEETGVLEARPALFKKIYNSPTSAEFEGHVYTLLRFMTRFGENRSATLRSSPKRRIFSFGGQPEETGVLEARPALFKKIYNSPTSAEFEGHVYTLLLS